jgi:hypothetical protein
MRCKAIYISRVGECEIRREAEWEVESFEHEFHNTMLATVFSAVTVPLPLPEAPRDTD